MKKILSNLVFKSAVVLTAFTLIVSVMGFTPSYTAYAVSEDGTAVGAGLGAPAESTPTEEDVPTPELQKSNDDTIVDTDPTVIGTAVDPVTTGTIVIHKNVIASNGTDIADNTSFNVNLNNDPAAPLRTVSENADATFADLQPGSYTVNEDAKAGYTTVSYSDDEDADVSNGGQVKVSAGEVTNVEIVNKQDGSGQTSDDTMTLKGMKFNDSNGNGVMDNGEQGLEGWTITLTSTGPGEDSNLISATDITDENGNYSFGDLPRTAGREFTVCEESRTDWHQNLPTASTEGATSCDKGTSGYKHVNAESDGLVIPDMNFGNAQNEDTTRGGSISGTVFYDRNGDENRDENEDGQSGWTIVLKPINIPDSELQMTTESDSNGNYTFSGLVKGTYEVCEINPESGWEQTIPSVDQTDGHCDYGNGYRVEITDGSNIVTSIINVLGLAKVASAASFTTATGLDFGNDSSRSGGGGGGGSSRSGGGSNGGNNNGSVLGASTGPDGSTAPGFPTTGQGGDWAVNLAVLLATGFLAAGGLTYLYRNKRLAVK